MKGSACLAALWRVGLSPCFCECMCLSVSMSPLCSLVPGRLPTPLTSSLHDGAQKSPAAPQTHSATSYLQPPVLEVDLYKFRPEDLSTLF